nr:DUF445 family protein [Niabella hibiscisoli]
MNGPAIRPYIEKLQVSSLLVQWLENPNNLTLLVTEISKILKDVVRKADDQMVTQFISTQSQKLLKEIKLNNAVASGLDIIMERGDQTRILSYLVTKLRDYVTENEPMVRERVKKKAIF